MHYKLCNYCALQNNVQMLKWALKNKYYINVSCETFNSFNCAKYNVPSIITLSLTFNKIKILKYLIGQLNVTIDSYSLHNIIRNNNIKMMKWVLANGVGIRQNEINLAKSHGRHSIIILTKQQKSHKKLINLLPLHYC